MFQVIFFLIYIYIIIIIIIIINIKFLPYNHNLMKHLFYPLQLRSSVCRLMHINLNNNTNKKDNRLNKEVYLKANN